MKYFELGTKQIFLFATAGVALISLAVAHVSDDETRFLAPGPYELTGSFNGGGAYFLVPPPGAERPRGLRLFGSWKNDPNHTGTLRSPAFTAQSAAGWIAMLVAGYPGKETNFLGVERVDSGERLRLLIDSRLNEQWQLIRWRLPAAWRAVPIRIVASSSTAGAGDWLAVSEPFYSCVTVLATLPRALAQIYSLALQLVLLLIVGRACALALSRHIPCSPIPAMLCGMGAAAYSALWFYMASPKLGRGYSWALILVSIAYSIRAMRRHQWLDSRIYSPVLVWFFASLLYLALGFAYGGIDLPIYTAANRYFHWTTDNELPYVYAAKLLHAPLDPVWNDWNVYARPPLQTGFVLLLSPFFFGHNSYQTLGILLQTSVLVAIWHMLSYLPVSVFTRRIALAIATFSLFVLMNSFFVWPKLLAGAFALVASTALLLARLPLKEAGALSGAALGLSMLSHGGSAFAFIAITIVFTLTQGRKILSRNAVLKFGVACGIALALYLPWSIRAGLSGKPTDQLTKWHLGGTIERQPSSESILTTIWKAYTGLPARTIVSNKVENLKLQFGIQSRTVVQVLNGPADVTLKYLLDLSASETIYVLLVPSVGLALLIVWSAFGKVPPSVLNVLFRLRIVGLLGLIGTVVWCLLMFGPQMFRGDNSDSSAIASLVAGSTFPVLCLLIAASALVAECSRPVAAAMLAMQVFIFGLLGAQGESTKTFLPELWDQRPLNPAMAICAVLGFLSLAVALRTIDTNENAMKHTAVQPTADLMLK